MKRSHNTEDLGHCGDIATLKQHLGLWRQLNDLVAKNDGPLPPAKHIIPTAIATRNRVKGDIDVYTRFLKNFHARHLHLPPLAAIWIRMLLSIMYNAYQSSKLLQFKSENMSFNSFFSEAAECIAELIPVENADLDFHNLIVTGEDDDESTASVAMSPKASTAYNKLNRFNEEPEFRQLRLSKPLPTTL
ncbi:hypothetical protein F443_02327 [Phytophthora nicotianae P1569]|uniref:Uncharacterized protein n=1 Tax=Phytophthora nicotianae P1569 TaxID=1317065 RepID=V9FU06_PHYNI|nr:hypothetical protein F443_02327 [Phytophthora nicotianae P1569]